MKYLLTITIALTATSNLFSQDSLTQKPTYQLVEIKPEFPGGISQFYSYVAMSLDYPAEARKQGAEGRVYVQFVVDEKGLIDTTSVKTINNVHELLNREAERIVKGSPQWIPGRLTKDGEPVRVKMALPIIFVMANSLDVNEKKNRKKKIND